MEDIMRVIISSDRDQTINSGMELEFERFAELINSNLHLIFEKYQFKVECWNLS